MIKSMTGYGRGESRMFDRRVVIEIKAVNHRYNDITIKMPRMLNPLEDSIRKRIMQETSRGKTDVYITMETFSRDDFKISFNEVLADMYVAELKEIVTRYGLSEDIPLEQVAGFPELVTVEKVMNENALSGEVLTVVMSALELALDEFVKMRMAEGMALKKNILGKASYIRGLTDTVRDRAPLTAEEYTERLSARIADTLAKVEINGIDESRLLTEIAIFADRSCIDEEITRLYSHILQLERILDENEAVGRKLDFLIQEMNREVNTISSKSNDLQITKTTIELKSELEKIREQVQNIE